MTRDQQRLVDYLGHITDAIERIDRYTGALPGLHAQIQDAQASLRNRGIEGHLS
jgi:hypothetical protein